VQADLGAALTRSGKPTEAVQPLERAIALDPDHTAAHYALARLLQRSGKTEEARAHMERARAGDEKNRRVMMARSLVNEGADHLRAGRTVEAVSSLRRAVELDPDNANARHNLGVALLASGAFQDALREFDAALGADSRRADTLYYAGRTWLALGNAQRALLMLVKATELKPNDAWAWNALAVAHLGADDSERATAALQQALSIDPGNELFQRNHDCLTKRPAGCRLNH
jgi:Flp pilus assembly protein TadD